MTPKKKKKKRRRGTNQAILKVLPEADQAIVSLISEYQGRKVILREASKTEV